MNFSFEVEHLPCDPPVTILRLKGAIPHIESDIFAEEILSNLQGQNVIIVCSQLRLYLSAFRKIIDFAEKHRDSRITKLVGAPPRAVDMLDLLGIRSLEVSTDEQQAIRSFTTNYPHQDFSNNPFANLDNICVLRFNIDEKYSFHFSQIENIYGTHSIGIHPYGTQDEVLNFCNNYALVIEAKNNAIKIPVARLTAAPYIIKKKFSGDTVFSLVPIDGACMDTTLWCNFYFLCRNHLYPVYN